MFPPGTESKGWHEETDNLNSFHCSSSGSSVGAQWWQWQCPIQTLPVGNLSWGHLASCLLLKMSHWFCGIINLLINFFLQKWTRDYFSEITWNPKSWLVHYHLLKSYLIFSNINESFIQERILKKRWILTKEKVNGYLSYSKKWNWEPFSAYK